MYTKIRFRFMVSAILLLCAALLAVTGIGPRQALAAPAAVVLPPSTACTAPGTGTVTCELWAKVGTLSLPGGATAPVWGYAASATGAAEVPGPALIANAGDTVVVTLHNDLAAATALQFEGQAMMPDLTGAAAGNQKTYTFTAAAPGTFLYEAGPLPNAQHQVPMGLYGALIVRPAAANQAYANPDSAYNDEALLVLSEIDPALNNSANPAAFDLRNYKPKYWLINGKAYPQTVAIDTAPGNKVLLRTVNAGQETHTMALLGAYQKVLAKAGAELPFYRQVVSEVLSTGQSMDAIALVPAAAPAGSRFAFYDGSLLLHNNGAAGFGGMLTFLTIPAGGPGADTLGPTASALALAPNPTNGTLPVSLTGSVSDAANGAAAVAAAEYRVDSTGASPMALAATDGTFDSPTEAVNATISAATLGTLTSGPHTIYVRGQDALGNWGVFSSVALTLDKTGPATSGISLNPATSTGAVSVALQATGNDAASGNANVTAAEYFIDTTGAAGTGAAITPNQVAPTVSFNATISAATMGALAEGSHTVHVRSQDALGNWGAFSTATLAVDKTGPNATGVTAYPSPNNGTLSATSTTQAVRVDATLTDPLSGSFGGGIQSAVKGAEGFIDTVGANGTGFAFTPNDGIFSATTEVAYAFIPLSTVSALSEGPHTIHVRGKDAAGNWGATTGTTLVVDKTKPTVSGVSASPNPTGGATNITLTASATDPDPAGAGVPSNLARAEWFRGADPGAGNATAMSATDGSFNSTSEGLTASINVSTWPIGSNTVYVRARDAAGNWSVTSSVVVTVQQGDAIFSDSFESGNFSAWSGSSGTRISVTTAAKMTGTGVYGMSAVLGSNTTPGYVFDTRPANETTYHARFYFNPNGAVTGNTQHSIFVGLNTANTSIFQVQYRRTGTIANPTYQVRATVTRAGGTTNGTWYTITNAAHAIEIAWASGASASFSLYTDGTLRQTLTGLNTSAYLLDTVRLGPSAGLTATMSGTEYFDAFVSTRTTVIGP